MAALLVASAVHRRALKAARAYLGNGDSFDRAIVEFSKAYAKQNESDYQELAAAAKAGRITAETGL